MCPFARTIGLVSLTIARWPLRRRQPRRRGLATYTIRWDATRKTRELLSRPSVPVLCPMPPNSALWRACLCAHIWKMEAMTASGSFEEFYTGAVSRLLGQLFLVTGDLHEAEEVVQEAFARASVRWSWLRDYNAPEAWVRRVAMNLAADRARKLRRQARAILRMGPPLEAPEVSVETLALVEALGTLPVRQRQAIVLHHLVGLPVEEVAQTLRMPAGTVKSLLSRGRRALAARLGEAEEVRDRP